MTGPYLLDLFCGQGGATRGYQRAGFTVYGVDIMAQPRYCGTAFWRHEAIDFVSRHSDRIREMFSAVHASPPCQAYSLAQRIRLRDHPDLISATRHALDALDLPYVLENVEGARKLLRNPTMLCGAMFGLRTYRHRMFETNGFTLYPPEHPLHVYPVTKMGRAVQDGEFMHVVGNFISVEYARSPAVMDMPWATRNGLREAIPPAYTAYIGKYLMSAI